jgi:hypothetical protein
MANLQVSKSVQKITTVERAESGQSRRNTVYEKKAKGRKTSTGLRTHEELTRRAAEAYRTFIDEYLARHNRSNNRRRDGWMFDLQENIYRAQRKALQQYNEDVAEDLDEDYEDEGDREDEDDDDDDEE